MRQSNLDRHYAEQFALMKSVADVGEETVITSSGMYCRIWFEGEWRPIVIPPPKEKPQPTLRVVK